MWYYSDRKKHIPYIYLAIFIAGWIVAYCLLSTVSGFVGTDDYYHSRIADQIIVQGKIRLDFTWLPLTILDQEHFVDHHLLYHLYLSPWIHWGGIVGIKIAQSLIVAGIGISFYSLLRYLKISWATLWTFGLLAVSFAFLYRMLMIRTQATAVLLLLLTFHALFRGKYRWLIVLSFAFTWLYNGFILLPVIVFLYVISSWITDRQRNVLPVIYAVGGMILGLVINPYFPQNLTFIVDHLSQKVDIADSIRVGSEWYPYTTSALIENAFGAMLVLGIGTVAPSFRKSGRDRVETTFLLTAFVMLYMVFRSRRFIEYYPAFSLLFCAVTWGRDGIIWQGLLPNFMTKRAYLGYTGLVGVILIFSILNITCVYKDIQHAKDLDYLAGASDWLAENTEPNTLVFQTDWDDFTHLFYHNTHNSYLIGLDTTYLQIADPFKWNQWVAITQGNVDRPSIVIQMTFGAEYVVSDTHHQAFAITADQDPNMKLVYHDANSLIWQIINEN